MESTTIYCLNCGQSFAGNFCSNCGQKSTIKRITWKEVFHNIPHMLFHLDDGFFYTIKQLAIKPGQTIRDYLEGKRKDYFNPFVMLLLLAGLCSALYVNFHIPTILASVSLNKLEEKNAFIAHKFFASRIIIFCLICSIGDYLVFKNHKYNLAEMVVANVMIFCEVSVIQLVFIPFFILGGFLEISLYMQVVFICSLLAYQFFARFQFFRAGGNYLLSGKIALCLFIYLIIFYEIGQHIIRPAFENQLN